MQPGMKVRLIPDIDPAPRWTAGWTAWRRRPARCSACCRRRMPPATSPRWCSACRSSWCSIRPGRAMPAGCAPGLSVTAEVDTRGARMHSGCGLFGTAAATLERMRAMTAAADRAQLAPVDRLHGDGARDVHGDPGHPDRLRLDLRHPGRACRQPGRGVLGADQLPDRRDRHDPAVRLAVARCCPPACCSSPAPRLHAVLRRLRRRIQPGRDGGVPGRCRASSAGR